MAENFMPKPKAAAKPKGGAKPKAAAKPKASAKAGSKADSLRALREKSASTDVAIVNATGKINTATLKTLDDFFAAGQIVWRRTVESIFEMSTLIDLAYDRLQREEYKQLLTKLHISESSANQLRKITETRRIVELHEKGVTLPTSSHTLYLLASMSAEDYDAFTERHEIDADVRVEDVRKFLQDRAAARKTPPTTTKQAEDEAKRELAGDLGKTPPTIDGDYKVEGEGEVGSFAGVTEPVAGEATAGVEAAPEAEKPSPDIEAMSPADAFAELVRSVLEFDAGRITALTADDVTAASELAAKAIAHLETLKGAFDDNLFERA